MIATSLYNNYAIYFDGEEVTEVYDLKSDPLQEINIKQGADLKNAKRLFKAYLQQYISRMINDEMSLK